LRLHVLKATHNLWGRTNKALDQTKDLLGATLLTLALGQLALTLGLG